tara:strand:+ start:3786 stop:4748 length:963 start_codon:yes stop_codon:yes gene_type:complete
MGIILLILIILSTINRIKNPTITEDQDLQNYGPGDYEFILNYDGLTREYFVHVPPRYDIKKSVPLIIDLHGGGGSFESAIIGTQMNKKSDSEGFIAVYPNSAESIDGGKRWNNGPRLIESQKESTANDIGFLNAMLDDLEIKFNIDKKRIYATGMSNGGFMTYRVACEMADRIAAIAPVASTLLMDNCNPSRSISVIHFHGLKDKIVNFEGGPSKIKSNLKILDDLRSVEESINNFVNINNCPTTSKITYQNREATCKTYSPCNQNTEVTLCTIKDGGHTWPGGNYGIDKTWYKKFVGKLSHDISANDAMWDFFEKHPMK